jgi:hypothetical protein
MQNNPVEGFDQLFAQRAQSTIEDHRVAIERALRTEMFGSAAYPVAHRYASLGWETLAYRQSESVGQFLDKLAIASTSTAFASAIASLLAEISSFEMHNRPFTIQRFARFLRLLPKLLRKSLARLVTDLGATAIGTGTWHLIETLGASYLASWAWIFQSLRQSVLSLARAIYVFFRGEGSIRTRGHVALIELAAALSSAISAGFQVVLNTLFPAPLLAALSGYMPWFDALIAGALFAAMVAALHLTDAAGVIRERRQALINAEADRALAAAENSAQIAGAAIERARTFYEALGVQY